MFGEVGAKTGTAGEWSKKDARRANAPPIACWTKCSELFPIGFGGQMQNDYFCTTEISKYNNLIATVVSSTVYHGQCTCQRDSNVCIGWAKIDNSTVHTKHKSQRWNASTGFCAAALNLLNGSHHPS